MLLDADKCTHGDILNLEFIQRVNLSPTKQAGVTEWHILVAYELQ